MNCWEYKKCGREPGGDKVHELGVCPAWPDMGRACAKVPGTFCDGQLQNTFQRKLSFCAKCDFYTSPYYQR